MTVIATAPDGRTLGESLLHQRLRARARRIEQVLAELDERVKAREAAGFVPEPLRQAVSGFRVELEDLRGRLARGSDR